MIIKLIPKTHSAFKAIENYGDLYRVLSETPTQYHLESVKGKVSEKGLTTYHMKTVQKFGNISYTIVKEDDIPMDQINEAHKKVH